MQCVENCFLNKELDLNRANTHFLNLCLRQVVNTAHNLDFFKRKSSTVRLNGRVARLRQMEE